MQVFNSETEFDLCTISQLVMASLPFVYLYCCLPANVITEVYYCLCSTPSQKGRWGGKQWSPPIHLFALEQWQELLILDKRIISGLVLPILHGGVRALCSGVPTQMDQMNLISCFFSFVRGHFLVVLVFSLGLVAHGCFGFSQSGRFIISRSHGSERHVAALFPWMDTQD